MLIAIACVHAAPPHVPPAPPPTPVLIPTPPAPAPTSPPPVPTSIPTQVPTIPPPPSPPGVPTQVPTVAPAPTSPPPPPPGVPTQVPTIPPEPTVLPTLPTINPTSNPTADPGTDTSNQAPSAPAPAATGTVPVTGQPTENPTVLPVLVLPTTQVVVPTVTQPATPGAIAGPAAGGGFSRSVEPVQSIGTPAMEIVTPVEIATGNQLNQQGFPGFDSLKSSPPLAPSTEKDPQGEVAAAPSDPSVPGSSDILDTLRGTARNASAVTPASKIVPPMAVPAVAVAAGMALALIGNLVSANIDNIFGSKIFQFLRDFLGENILQRVDEYEAKKRAIGIRAAGKTALGLTHSEILVVVAGALFIGIASLVAIRAAFEINTILLYVITGGVAVTVHEMGHRYAAHHHEVQTEVKFWALGTIIMFFTGWFAGNVFAQPHRTIMEESEEQDHTREGKISLAGPFASIGLAVLTVPFLFVGGDITTIASTLLMMTLLIAIYHLMPFTPMDGKEILHWNRYLLIFMLIPMVIIYYYLFLM